MHINTYIYKKHKKGSNWIICSSEKKEDLAPCPILFISSLNILVSVSLNIQLSNTEVSLKNNKIFKFQDFLLVGKDHFTLIHSQLNLTPAMCWRLHVVSI